MGSSGRRTGAQKALDLTAEEPGTRADLEDSASSFTFGGKLFGGSMQFALQGAKSWAVTHVVLTFGGMVPALGCLTICKIAGAPPAVTLWTSLATFAGSYIFTGVLQVTAHRGGPGAAPKTRTPPRRGGGRNPNANRRRR